MIKYQRYFDQVGGESLAIDVMTKEAVAFIIHFTLLKLL